MTRAVRASLKEAERVDADRRAFQALRYQEWKNGQSSEHVCGICTEYANQ